MKTQTFALGWGVRCPGFFFCILVAALLWGALSTARAATPVAAGYRDFDFGTTCIATPTGEKPESKLWFNGGFWWGSLCNGTQAYHIYKLDPGTQDWVDTGTQIDNRPHTKADTLWDETSQKLYVASHRANSNGQPSTNPNDWGRLYRYSYNAGNTYTLDPGFPVTVTQGKSETLTLAKDTTGRLWVTYVESRQVLINHSLGSDDTAWGTPFALPVADRVTTSDDISSIIAFDGRIGVMWSNQSTKKMYFAQHVDGQGDAAADWQSTVVYAPPGSAADDHINLKALPPGDPAGIVFAVTKTSFTSSTAPLLNLLVCTSSTGAGCASAVNWQAHQIYTVANHPTRGILLIDTGTRMLNVLNTNSDGGGAIHRKTAALDDIQFASGQGAPFIQSSTDTAINNVSSAKRNLDATTGLVGVASDENTHWYLHNVLSLGSPVGPVITSFTPTSGPVGTQVTITGTNFTGATAVAFNGTAATSFTVDSATQITATVPTGATTGPISVTTPAGTGTSSGSFTVTQAPQAPVITSFTPTSGPVGTSVIITGTGFTGASLVDFNGTSVSCPSANCTVNSATQITATVPTGATTGPISVTTPAGTGTTESTFTVTTAAPNITYQDTVSGGSTSSNTVMTAGNVTAMSGQLYLAAIVTSGNKAVNSVGGMGLTWSLVKAQCSGRGAQRVEVWSAQGTSTGVTAPVSATLAAVAANAVIAVSRYSGAASIGNVVSGNTLGANTTTCTGGVDSSTYSVSLTTPVNGTVAYGAAALRNRGHTAGAGYTERVELHQGVVSQGNVAGVAAEDKTVSVTPTLVDGTLSGTVDWAVIGLVVQP